MKKTLLLTVVLAFVLCAACRPGRQIETINANTTTATQAALTAEDVRRAIIAACAQKGWRPYEQTPGVIEAQLVVRGKHTVIVDIPYTAQNYSIKYKSSTNMEYKADSGKIHPNYNKWVNMLNNEINLQLVKGKKS